MSPPGSSRFCLFVHAKTLLRYAETWDADTEMADTDSFSSLSSSSSPSPPDVDWDEWGPQHTRAVPQHSAFQWLRYVHGQRVVLPPLTIQDGRDVEKVVRVLDFCVHPLRFFRRPESAGEDERQRQQWYTPAKLDLECAVFREPLVTSLPCVLRETQGKDYQSFTGFMIDDQRLVGLRASAFSEEDMGDLDVFVF
jgi:hypothetical protein